MQEPNIAVKTYVWAYVALIVLLLVNIGIGFLDLGWGSMFIALVIGIMQAGIIALVLMEALYEKALIHVVMGGALLWFMILITLTFTDYITRNWVPIAGK